MWQNSDWESWCSLSSTLCKSQHVLLTFKTDSICSFLHNIFENHWLGSMVWAFDHQTTAPEIRETIAVSRLYMSVHLLNVYQTPKDKIPTETTALSVDWSIRDQMDHDDETISNACDADGHWTSTVKWAIRQMMMSCVWLRLKWLLSCQQYYDSSFTQSKTQQYVIW